MSDSTGVDAGRRPPLGREDLPFLALAVISVALVVYLGRSLTFWNDEWRFITFDGSGLDYLRPFNEHWNTLPLLLYRATYAVVGLRTYLPYLLEVVVLHVVAVAAAYVLVRGRLGAATATLLALPLLLLGAGSENLFSAFQTVFVASLALGLWAIVALESGSRHGPWIAALLLVLSVMTSGMGLVMLFLVFARAVLDTRLRGHAVVVVPALATFVVWYLTIGQDDEVSEEVASPAEIVGFVLRGSGRALGGLTGLGSLPAGDVWAAFLFLAALVLTAWAFIRTRAFALGLSCLVSIAVMYVLIGAVRAHLPADFVTRSRYVYIAAFLLVLAAADWLVPVRERVPRSWFLAGLAVLAGVVTAVNVDALVDMRDDFRERANLTRGIVMIGQTRGGEDWIDPQGMPSVHMPPLPELVELVEERGSLLEDALVPGIDTRIGDGTTAAMSWLVGERYRDEPAARGGTRVPMRLVDGDDATLADRCVGLATSGDEVTAVVEVLPGTRFRTSASSTMDARVTLGAVPHARPVHFTVGPGAPIDVLVPEIPGVDSWRVALAALDGSGELRACSYRPAR